MTSLRVVVAPDSFKGSATAADVAAAVARGWRAVRPEDVVRTVPMADGGEGTLDAFAAAVPGVQRVPVRVEGPDGREVATHWVLLPDGTGVVELAATSGITLLDRLRPLGAHTRGFGQAIAAALDHGVDRLLLGLGGSASTDGGAGALAVLGARFLDTDGVPVPPGNRGLSRLATVDLGGLRPPPARGVLVLSDVTHPLLGPHGAAAVFGPQKGAAPDDVPEMDANLARLASLVRAGSSSPGPGADPFAPDAGPFPPGAGRFLPGAAADPSAPGTGAAGGTGFGLLVWGATLVSGAAALGDLLGVPEAVRAADVVITGEGCFDDQSAAGKVPSYLLDQARSGVAAAMLVAGRIDAPTDAFTAAVALVDLAPSLRAALEEAPRWLDEAGSRLAATVPR